MIDLKKKLLILKELYLKNLLVEFISKEIKIYKLRKANKAFLIELFNFSVEDAIKNLKNQEWENLKKKYKK